ncbi:hypothetical protein L1887_31829 [Cichorium endivia]|nr:hypothetical protein L1887_31829 [Cichorium endivia]
MERKQMDSTNVAYALHQSIDTTRRMYMPLRKTNRKPKLVWGYKNWSLKSSIIASTYSVNKMISKAKQLSDASRYWGGFYKSGSPAPPLLSGFLDIFGGDDGLPENLFNFLY